MIILFAPSNCMRLYTSRIFKKCLQFDRTGRREYYILVGLLFKKYFVKTFFCSTKQMIILKVNSGAMSLDGNRKSTRYFIITSIYIYNLIMPNTPNTIDLGKLYYQCL